jgi:nucleotide-binding universal stress UspA family protein
MDPVRVVVGLDDSAGSAAALRWALHWALGRNAEIAVLAVHSTDAYYSDATYVDLLALDAVHAGTWARARAAIDGIRDDDAAIGGVPVSLHVEPGPAGDQLIRYSADADLLVVGSRGHGAFRSAVLGSVALHSVSTAECPVVVVPLSGSSVGPGAGCRVVVGVDGSERSATALAAAVTEAGAGGSVTVVRALDGADLWGDQYPVEAGRAQQRRRDDDRRRWDLTVDGILSATTGAPPAVEHRTVRGQAGPVLVDEAAAADLLVVASRGHGEFRGILFGSVALYCLMHAPCPVLVVRPAARRLPPRPTPVAAPAAT